MKLTPIVKHHAFVLAVANAWWKHNRKGKYKWKASIIKLIMVMMSYPEWKKVKLSTQDVWHVALYVQHGEQPDYV